MGLKLLGPKDDNVYLDGGSRKAAKHAQKCQLPMLVSFGNKTNFVDPQHEIETFVFPLVQISLGSKVAKPKKSSKRLTIFACLGEIEWKSIGSHVYTPSTVPNRQHSVLWSN